MSTRPLRTDPRADGPTPLRTLSPEGLSALTTEHYTLQSARAATTHESNGRASLYLASVGGGVVALAYVADSSGTSTPAQLFAATVLVALTLMGLITHQRLVHLAVEDAVLGQAINRVRSAYLHAAPDIAPYLLLPAQDDRSAVLHAAGLAESRWHHLSHMAVMVAVVVAAVTGTAGAMLADALHLGLSAAVGAGVATASGTLLVLVGRQVRAWTR